MPHLIVPEHKPNPRSTLGHPREAQQVLSKRTPGSTGGSWVAAATQSPPEPPRSTSQPAGPGQHPSPALPPPSVRCHEGDNQARGTKPISEVTQK